MADILKTGFANPTIDRELLLDLFFEYLAEYESTASRTDSTARRR
jgi:hypothetical protein